MTVKLQDVIDGITFANAEAQFFYHTKTGKVLILMDNIYGIGRDKALMKDIDRHPDDYLSLPNEYEVDEFAMMADFVDTLDDSAEASALFRILEEDGNAAVRLFKQSVRAFDLEQEWNEFRDGCYAEIARQWCSENDIEYEE